MKVSERVLVLGNYTKRWRYNAISSINFNQGSQEAKVFELGDRVGICYNSS